MHSVCFLCFDRIFSFDKVDCKNLKLRFLPLFYIPDYGDIPKSKSEIKYDVLFCWNDS